MIKDITPPEGYNGFGEALMQPFTITNKTTKEIIEAGYMIVPIIKKENPTKEDLDNVREALIEVTGIIDNRQQPMKEEK